MIASPTIKAILFDAYGTLLDIHSIAQCADEIFPSQGVAISALLREKQIEYSRLRSMAGQYKSFWDITRDALQFTCASKGLALTQANANRLMSQYAKLAPFNENIAVLKQLKAIGLPLGVLTNGNKSMIDAALSNAQMQSYFDHVLSSESVQKFKPDPAIYALGPDALKLPVAQILFVSSNAWDACAAQWFGYQAFWINRAQVTIDQLDVVPARQGKTLEDVLAVFKPLALGQPSR